MLHAHGAIKRRWMPVSLLVLVVVGALYGAASAYGDGDVTVMTQNLYQGTEFRHFAALARHDADIRTGSRRHDSRLHHLPPHQLQSPRRADRRDDRPRRTGARRLPGGRDLAPGAGRPRTPLQVARTRQRGLHAGAARSSRRARPALRGRVQARQQLHARVPGARTTDVHAAAASPSAWSRAARSSPAPTSRRASSSVEPAVGHLQRSHPDDRKPARTERTVRVHEQLAVDRRESARASRSGSSPRTSTRSTRAARCPASRPRNCSPVRPTRRSR